jgi:hypothetical protein
MDFENPQHLLAAAQKARTQYLKTVQATSISVQQAASLQDNPVKGPVWVSKFTVPKPAIDNSRDLLLKLVDEENYKKIRYDRPDSEPLRCEWTGFRGNVGKDTPEPALAEREKFMKLSAETKSPLSIFYVYGGSFVFVIEHLSG